MRMNINQHVCACAYYPHTHTQLVAIGEQVQLPPAAKVQEDFDAQNMRTRR